MYTSTCADLAARGAVVIAPEHEDGSASYAVTAAGEELYFERPPKEGEKLAGERDEGDLTVLMQTITGASQHHHCPMAVQRMGKPGRIPMRMWWHSERNSSKRGWRRWGGWLMYVCVCFDPLS